MKYNPKLPTDIPRARDYLETLIKAGSHIEIKKVSPRRSLNQNAYLHILIAAFSSHFGFTLAEGKVIYKRLSADIYTYDKNGMKFLRSSADLTKDEMTKTIDRFREYSAEQDYPLPLATDQAWIDQLSNSIEMNQRYL